MDITQIDKNFAVPSEVQQEHLKWYSPLDEPFSVCGVLTPDETEAYYRRLPGDVAKATSEGVYELHKDTTGGRIRFVTDSPFVAIHTKMFPPHYGANFSLCGAGSFDIYVAKEGGALDYADTFRPPVGMTDGYESIVYFPDNARRVIIINMPLYAGVKEVYVGLHEQASIAPAPAYTYETPIVYYGSSITQGGSASRPGNSYESMIGRRLDADFINLGFSGNARGEQVMAEYIAGLDMSLFVMDYDHNAPNAEHLRETHYAFYETIRKAHPTLPIVMVTAPIMHPNPHWAKRRDIIRESYQRAVAAGDENVRFVPGESFFADLVEDAVTGDNCHPNDLGFWCMANTLTPLFKKILSK